jgi:thiol-disulfide isomerase/thioredoxin
MEILNYTKIKELKKSGMSYDTTQFETLGKSIIKNLSDTLVISRTIKTITYIDSLFDNNKADFLKMKLSSKDLKESMLILEIILEDCKTKWVEEILQTNYKRILDNQSKIDDVLKNGKKFNSNSNIGEPILELPFGARLFVVEDIDPGLLLSNIKSAFNGKALILDFWATWCAPCLGDLPYSKKLHNEMKDEAIEFVYLCTSQGSDIDTWKSKISDLELGGTHIFVEASIESKLMSLLSLGGFPSYGFINAKGEYKAGAISWMSNLKKDNLLEIMKDN